MNALDKTNNTRFLIICASILSLLHVAILAVLLLRDAGSEGSAIRAPQPDCISGFGLNPKLPRNPAWDCEPAPVRIQGRA